MKILLLFVILSTIAFAKPSKIDVRVHPTKPLAIVINGYSQAVYCQLKNKNKVKDFYVLAKSTTAPMHIDKKTFKYWCKLPKLNV